MMKIEKAIIKTLAYFEVFGRPLKLEEIWQFLYRTPASKLQVLIALEKLEKKKQIFKKDQYYCLIDRKLIINKFIQNQNLIKKRWQKVAWVVKILQLAPFIKNISVINSLSFGTSNEDSDIDLLVITKKGRLWTTRALVILLLEIIGQNKNKWYKAGKFCLGFAFDETRLNLGKIAKNFEPHFVYWLANLWPVYNKGIYREFIEVNLLKKFLPNWQAPTIKNQSQKFSWIEKLLSGKFGDRFEEFLAKIQIKKVWADPKHRAKLGLVEADRSMLKMHPKDQRPEYLKSWQMRLDKIFRNF